jgi:expansin (peptidoglycan-binding protein)
LKAQVSCSNETVYSGEGTYYDIAQFGNFGNCSIENNEFNPFLIGAMNASQYGKADFCGSCVLINGPKGSVKVHIIDQCPECKFGDIDLSPQAFDYLAPRVDGRIKISWKLVPCDVSGPIQFYFKEGSNQWWTAVQIRNHRNKIAKLEIWKGSAYVDVPRQDYNYFLASSGFGTGPYKFRVTDVYGNSIVEDNVVFKLTTEINGQNQFPVCGIVGTEELELQEEYTTAIVNNTLVFLRDLDYEIVSVSGVLISQGHSYEGLELKLNSGFYLVKTYDNKLITTQKLIIE